METNKKKIILADIGILFVALFWGGAFVAGKFALEGITPLMITAYRYAGAAILMLIICNKNLKHITKKIFWPAASVGFLTFLGNTVQTIGLQFTTPGKQSFIISLYTVLVPLLSWIILKQKPTKKVIVAATVALIGISLLTLTDDLTIGFGDGLTFIFAITFSLQMIIIGRHIKGVNPMVFTFIQIAVAGGFSLVTAFLFEEPVPLIGLPWESLASLFYLVVFNSVLAFVLQNSCQRYAPPNHTAILLASETVFGTIFAITLAGEVFSPRMVLGCVLMFVAIGISEMPKIGKKNASF